MKSRDSTQSAIFENLSRQENLTVSRFTLVETFFLDVNEKLVISINSAPADGSRFPQAYANISNFNMPGPFAYKKEGYIQNMDACFLCREGCQMLLFHLQ